MVDLSAEARVAAGSIISRGGSTIEVGVAGDMAGWSLEEGDVCTGWSDDVAIGEGEVVGGDGEKGDR